MDCDGHDLEGVRREREALEAEVLRLRAIPTPSHDIEERLRDYVYSVARPQITGIGKGEKLKIVWPGSGWNTKGPIEHRADSLALEVLARGDALVAGFMRVIKDMAGDPAARKKRIAELEAEIYELAYIEAALVDEAIAHGTDLQRSPSIPPQAVLGVKVAKVKANACAA